MQNIVEEEIVKLSKNYVNSRIMVDFDNLTCRHIFNLEIIRR